MFQSRHGRLLALMACALFMFVFTPTSSFAAPAEGTPVTLQQPNGLRFTATPWGDEWYSGYDHNGYTILRNDVTNVWYYAADNGFGKLAPTQLRVGIDDPSGLKKHLRDKSAVNSVPAGARLDASRPWPGVSGSQPVLVILVEFDNQESVGSDADDWNSAFFDTNGKTVKTYYDEASYNQFTIDPAAETHGTDDDGVIGWITVDMDHPSYPTNNDNREAVRAALIAADPYIDYSDFDTDSSGGIDVTELHLVIITAGWEAAFGGQSNSCGPNHTWGHRWSLSGSVSAPQLDGVLVGDNGSGGGYSNFGEFHERGSNCDGSSGHMATIGIMVHELGHDIAWPDLYDTDFSSEGAGNWSVMAGGTWGKAFGEDQGTTPILPDPYSKWYQKWLTPIEPVVDAIGLDLPVAATSDVVYQVLPNPGGVDWEFRGSSGTGEFFLIENRQQVGFDEGLYLVDSDAGGCLIWHIDETRTSSNSNNNDETRKHVDVEEANDEQDMDNHTNRGDLNDTWPGSNNMTTFSLSTTPNNDFYDGTNSGFSIENISTAGSGCTLDIDFAGLGIPTTVQLANNATSTDDNPSLSALVTALLALCLATMIVARRKHAE